MDIHNVVILGWYVIQILLFLLVEYPRGYSTMTRVEYAAAVVAYGVMATTIFAFGDPSSWQAITLFILWSVGAVFGIFLVGRRDTIGNPLPVVLVLGGFGLLGAYCP